MTVYEGEPGWSGPLQIRTQDGRQVEAQCLHRGETWPLQQLAADKLSRVVGPASCPNRCGEDDAPGLPRAGFRPDSEPHIG